MILGEETDDVRSAQPTPLYGAFAELSAANAWTTVNGFAFARRFTDVATEYDALTAGCAVVDLSVLKRYSVRGPEAAAVLARLTSAPTSELRSGESGRGLVLDAAGGVLDHCEVTRLAPELFLLTTSASCNRRLAVASRGFEAYAEDISDGVAALGVFGPDARAGAEAAGFEVDVDGTAAQVRVRGVESFARPTSLGRAIGVELIFPADEALAIWERVRRAAKPVAAGLDACEIVRLEGGTPRPGRDFPRADDDPSGGGRSPAEIGLPHLAPLDRAWFTGRRALRYRSPTRALAVALVDADEASGGGRMLSRVRRMRKGEAPTGRIGSVRTTAFSPHFRGAIAMVEFDLDAAPGGPHGAPPKRADGEEWLIDTPGGALAGASVLETHEARLADAYRSRLAATESRLEAV
ncbi:MAG: hypothetical protein AAFX08_08970 [Pseudomonadota bacterium]